MKKLRERITDLEKKLYELDTMVWFLTQAKEGKNPSFNDDTVADHLRIYYSTIEEISNTMDLLCNLYGDVKLKDIGEK